MINTLEAFNRDVFLYINGGTDTPAWLIRFAIVIADYLIYLIPLLFIVMWLWSTHIRRSISIKAFLITMSALGINQIIGLIWTHPRPFMIGLGHIWMHHKPESSFPSDHVTVFASIGLALLMEGSFLSACIILVAGLAVAWARVFLGVHFPLDIAGGVAVACMACAIIYPLWIAAGDSLVCAAERLYRRIFAPAINAGWIRN